MPNVAEIACIHCKPAKPLPNVSNFSKTRLHVVSYVTSAGLGRFHHRRWRFRFHLRQHGFECEGRKHAGEPAETARKHLRQTSLPSALEIRVVYQPK